MRIGKLDSPNLAINSLFLQLAIYVMQIRPSELYLGQEVTCHSKNSMVSWLVKSGKSIVIVQRSRIQRKSTAMTLIRDI